MLRSRPPRRRRRSGLLFPGRAFARARRAVSVRRGAWQYGVRAIGRPCGASLVVVALDCVFVVVDELGEDATECVEVSFGEGVDEVVLDSYFVWWPNLFEPGATMASEGDVEAPSVVRVEVPANEPVVFHAIKHAGEAAATERVAQHH